MTTQSTTAARATAATAARATAATAARATAATTARATAAHANVSSQANKQKNALAIAEQKENELLNLFEESRRLFQQYTATLNDARALIYDFHQHEYHKVLCEEPTPFAEYMLDKFGISSTQLTRQLQASETEELLGLAMGTIPEWSIREISTSDVTDDFKISVFNEACKLNDGKIPVRRSIWTQAIANIKAQEAKKTQRAVRQNNTKSTVGEAGKDVSQSNTRTKENTAQHTGRPENSVNKTKSGPAKRKESGVDGQSTPKMPTDFEKINEAIEKHFEKMEPHNQYSIVRRLIYSLPVESFERLVIKFPIISRKIRSRNQSPHDD